MFAAVMRSNVIPDCALGHPAAEALADGHREIAVEQLWPRCEPLGELHCTCLNLLLREDFRNRPPLERFGGGELALGEDEMPSAVEPEHLLPDHLDPVARDDTERQVGEVPEHGRLACHHNVRKQRVLAVDGGGTVDRCDDRHLKVGKPLHHTLSLSDDRVPHHRFRDVAEARSVDLGHEPVARTGDDEGLVVAIHGDVVEDARKRRVHRTRERHGSSTGVEAQSQNPARTPLEHEEVGVVREVIRCH
jgi:hypothetical protein